MAGGSFRPEEQNKEMDWLEWKAAFCDSCFYVTFWVGNLVNSMWQHPTENDIPALSGRVLNLPRSSQISLTWSSGIAGAVSATQQNTRRRMPTSLLVFLGSSLLTGTTPWGSSRQEWHSPMAGWSYSWRPRITWNCSPSVALPLYVESRKQEEMSSYCCVRKWDESQGRRCRQKTLEQAGESLSQPFSNGVREELVQFPLGALIPFHNGEKKVCVKQPIKQK